MTPTSPQTSEVFADLVDELVRIAERLGDMTGYSPQAVLYDIIEVLDDEN